MKSLLLFIVCLALFIIQIKILVKAVKNKEKKYWIIVFCLEIIPIILLMILYHYYTKLAPRGGFMPGMQYFGEELTCFGASILYFAMLCITIIAGIIVYEKNQRINNKNPQSPIKLISAFVLILIGFLFLMYEVRFNWGKEEAMGTVVYFEEHRTGNGINYWPIIEFNADGQVHKDSYPISDVKIGDSIKIYYSANRNYLITSEPISYEIIWIPTILIGILIIFFRFKETNKKE